VAWLLVLPPLWIPPTNSATDSLWPKQPSPLSEDSPLPGRASALSLYHRIAQLLLLPIFTYCSDLFSPNSCSLKSMNSFWHKVQRWTTNTFSSIPTFILSRLACLPPIAAYCKHRSMMIALGLAYTPRRGNPATARLLPFFPSLSIFMAQDSARYLTRELSSIYLRLDWHTAVPSPGLRKHLSIDALADLIFPLREGLSQFHLILHTAPPPGTEIPGAALMAPPSKSPRERTTMILLNDWAESALPPSTTICSHLHCTCTPSWASANSLQEGSTKCAGARGTLPPTSPGSTKTAASHAQLLQKPQTLRAHPPHLLCQDR